MTKKYLILIICCMLIFAIVLKSVPDAHADALTISMVAASSYALAADWGISFTSGSATASGMQNWMSSQIENYVNESGGSLVSLFGSEVIRSVAGKLVIGQQIYNGVKQFISWLAEKFDLSDEDLTLSEGSFEGTSMGSHISTSSEAGEGIGLAFGGTQIPDSRYVYNGYDWFRGYNNGVFVTPQSSAQGGYAYTGAYSLVYEDNAIYAYTQRINRRTGEVSNIAKATLADNVYSLDNHLSWNGSDYVVPIVLNPDKEWSGTIGGEAVPDTNLDQLMGDIFNGVADNNLDVDGEVIDIPIPPPTPQPIDPDTPLSDVPWEGMDTNLQNLYNQGLEEIGAIGDAQDAITDAVEEQTGALEGAIADNAGVVSGAIDQAVSDIQDAIGDQTAALDQSMSATAEATESIAEALEDETINWQKFDLRGLFPFCIPFDIYNMLEALDASPTAPHVELPFVIESIDFSYTIDLDFSDFDTVAAVIRQMELIVYGISLAWATSKVIKW